MPDNEIRALYAGSLIRGRLARLGYLDTGEVEADLDVLAADGLLPTIRYTRVHPCDCQPCPECEEAALADGAVRQESFATDWKPVEGEQR